MMAPVFVAFLWFLICLGSVAARAQAVDSSIQIVKGTVLRQVSGCEVDGICSVIVKTDKGEETVVWNTGMMAPPICRTGQNDAQNDASYLIPGDKVEIHMPVAANGVLCGPGASVTRLDVAAVPIKTLRGIVVKQDRSCQDAASSKPCSLTLHTDSGDQDVIWRKKTGGLFDKADCRRSKAADDAGILQPNDQVEIDLPVTSGTIICGDGAAVRTIPDPVDVNDMRVVQGVVTAEPDCSDDCTLTIQSETGFETFIYSSRTHPHPVGCHFAENGALSLYTLPGLGDEVEIRLPVASKNILCGSGAAITKLPKDPYGDAALRLQPTSPDPNPAIRIVRGIITKNDSYGIAVETGLGVERLNFSATAINGCQTPMGLVAQLQPFKRGDAIEIKMPASGPHYASGQRYLCEATITPVK